MSERIPAKFKNLINHLVEQIGKIGEGSHNEAQRPWLDFQDLTDAIPTGNFDLNGLKNFVDRTEANNTYLQATQDEEAEDADIAVPKLAADFLSTVERDFIGMRKRSRIRMMVHAGVRDRVNGDANTGPLVTNTLRFLAAIENVKKVGT